jgi:hypothetical protein
MRVQNRESGAEVKVLYSGRYKRKEGGVGQPLLHL